MGLVVFNGVSSMDLNILVERPPGYEIPSKRYETIDIPGRNGKLYISDGTYENVDRTYEIAIGDKKRWFPDMANTISGWVNSTPDSELEPWERVFYKTVEDRLRENPLSFTYEDLTDENWNPFQRTLMEFANYVIINPDDSEIEIKRNKVKKHYEEITSLQTYFKYSNGYMRLEDSYEPMHYRFAKYVRETDIENILFHAGRSTITFDCMPQRFLKSGARLISSGELSVKMSIFNPTMYSSYPLIKANGHGSLVINDKRIYISENATIVPYVVIDCEKYNAFYQSYNCNSMVDIPDNVVLYPGENRIRVRDGYIEFELYPRWWEL